MDKLKAFAVKAGRCFLNAEKSVFISSLFVTMLILALIINPTHYLASVADGCRLFVTAVLPPLFPFFFLTGLLTRMGCADKLGRLLNRPVSFLYNAPGCGGYVCCMSLMSGYPVGARLLRELYDGKSVNTRQCAVISSFTSTSGPLFIVGTVSTIMFSSPQAGYILLAVHIVSALLNGFMYRGKPSDHAGACLTGEKHSSLSSALPQSMRSAIMSTLSVGGYVVIFGLIADVLDDSGVIDMITDVIMKVFAFVPLRRDIVRAAIIGTIEVTRGCRALAQSGITAIAALPLLSAMLAWGGLSVAMQSLSFLSDCGIKTGYFLLTKFTQCLISAAAGALICAVIAL